MKTRILLSILWLIGVAAFAQPQQLIPQTYILAELNIKGNHTAHPAEILSISGLQTGMAISLPGVQLSDAIRRLWKTELFEDIQFQQDSLNKDGRIFLSLVLVERARISDMTFKGISKRQAEELKEQIKFIRGGIFTEAKRVEAERIVRNYFIKKGYAQTQVDVQLEEDAVLKHRQRILLQVEKGKKMHIHEMELSGNQQLSETQVKRKLKGIGAREGWKIWNRARYTPKKYDEAKAQLLAYYQDLGYRDAQIVADSVYHLHDHKMLVSLHLDEGQQYVIRNINWTGNVSYNTAQLSALLGIKKGDIYSKSRLDQRLHGDPQGTDISSLYLDNGHLFFRIEAVESAIEGDSVDLEMRISEGPLTTIGNVYITGNTKTSDEVINRQIRTRPGEVFSRAALIRSQRELIALNYFAAEKMNVVPQLNEETGTVDLHYQLEEKPSDRIQLQGGWSPQVTDDNGNVISGGLLGTLQLDLTNFSTKRLFSRKDWRPVPMGDGQRLSLAFQTDGTRSKNLAVSFQEPWLGGKKPNFLGVSTNYYSFENLVTPEGGTESISFSNKTLGASIDYGFQLSWPDDFSRMQFSLGYKHYSLENPGIYYPEFADETEAEVHALTLRQSFNRTSVDHPLFPSSGSITQFDVEVTPPYSLFGEEKDYANMSTAEKVKMLEYHKWTFKHQSFWNFAGDFVLHGMVESGYLGAYNPAIGAPPFERFVLGGSGLLANGVGGLKGLSAIPLRGYAAQALDNDNNYFTLYNRAVLEIRHPIKAVPGMPIWLLGFAEAGNGYSGFKEYRPFDLKRSAGLGFRMQLPMVGLIGLDWGYGFDPLPGEDKPSGGQFHLIFGREF